MKTKITLVRHAQTKANMKRSFSGRKEVPLSTYGYQQIRDLTNRLRGIAFDAVYSSPMKRAIETVRPIAKELHQPVITDDGLLELSYGELEGTPRDEIADKFPDVWEFFIQYDYFKGVPGQEEVEEGLARFMHCLKRLARLHPNGHILVASHGMIIRIFVCYLLGMPFSKLPEVDRTRNTALTELEFDFDTEKFTLLSYNDVSHEEIL